MRPTKVVSSRWLQECDLTVINMKKVHRLNQSAAGANKQDACSLVACKMTTAQINAMNKASLGVTHPTYLAK